MGCNSSCQVDAWDMPLNNPGDGGSTFHAKHKPTTPRASKVAMRNSSLPHQVEGCESENCVPDFFRVSVPADLREVIKPGPILTEFSEPTEVESSWDMPSMAKRWKDLPANLMLPPDREMHSEHLNRLEKALRVIKRSPDLLRQGVDRKRRESGMAPVGSHEL